jgi:prevent-host-death family protein
MLVLTFSVSTVNMKVLELINQSVGGMTMKTQRKAASTVVSALTARTQLGQILERVETKNERFIIKRRGQPQAIVMSIEDYVDIVAPAPDWLKSIQADSKKNGTDKLTMREIDAEIAATRRDIARQKAKKAS